MSSSPDRTLHMFSRLIRDVRHSKNMTLDELIERSGVSRSTVLRYEAYKVGEVARPDPENVRAIFRVLDIPFVEAVIALGYLTREDAGLSPEPPRIFDATVEEVIEILQDPDVPETQKAEWVHYLRFRTGRTGPTRGRRAGR